jgi:glutamine cyclotransferase
MKTEYPRILISAFFTLILVWTLSCSGKSGNKKEEAVKSEKTEAAEERLGIKMVSPEENTGFKLKDPISIVLSVDKEKRTPDSVSISFDSHHVATLKSEPWEYVIPSELTNRTGRKSVKITGWEGGSPQSSITRFMIIYSDIVPETYGYKIIHTYPHDRNAFTQGLFYYKGVLYEGTGQESGSSLREVELESGKVIRQHNLDASLFGEGITLYNDRIFQVTWEDKIGFVYDRATFNQINKIYYPTQGWGLTTIGNRIALSDGTNVIYFYEPESFTAVSRIEVYDNKQMVDSLNELEFINGEIWANIWMTDKIARIDPETGKVTGYINLSGLLKDSDKSPDTDVLNGIAYDQASGRIFVTGKRWPKLFEIKLTK